MLPEGYPVKRGDTLAVSGRRDGQYKRVTVDRVTGRHIFISNGSKFTLDGRAIGDFATSELHPLTEEIEAAIKREARIQWLKEFPYERMSDEFLEKITAFLNQSGHDTIK